MTHLEYLDGMMALEQEGRELSRAHMTQLSLIEADHRKNMMAETERYLDARRRQMAEFNTRIDDLAFRKAGLRRQRAISFAEENK